MLLTFSHNKQLGNIKKYLKTALNICIFVIRINLYVPLQQLHNKHFYTILFSQSSFTTFE